MPVLEQLTYDTENEAPSPNREAGFGPVNSFQAAPAGNGAEPSWRLPDLFWAAVILGGISLALAIWMLMSPALNLRALPNRAVAGGGEPLAFSVADKPSPFSVRVDQGRASRSPAPKLQPVREARVYAPDMPPAAGGRDAGADVLPRSTPDAPRDQIVSGPRVNEFLDREYELPRTTAGSRAREREWRHVETLPVPRQTPVEPAYSTPR
ncbi:MAG: hypothetical protein HYZ57_02660 [Acidobacteria bacterium]|nr:hypothetical protein [Acidobacteriota bacterium]